MVQNWWVVFFEEIQDFLGKPTICIDLQVQNGSKPYAPREVPTAPDVMELPPRPELGGASDSEPSWDVDKWLNEFYGSMVDKVDNDRYNMI